MILDGLDGYEEHVIDLHVRGGIHRALASGLSPV